MLTSAITFIIYSVGNRREIVCINRMQRDAKSCVTSLIISRKAHRSCITCADSERGTWKSHGRAIIYSCKTNPAYIFSQRRNSFCENVAHDRISRVLLTLPTFSASQDNALYFQYGCNFNRIKARSSRNFDAVKGILA